jgi:hypothetical protein
VTIFISDTAMVRNWFISNDDTLQVNNGLVFSPTNTGLIKGFYSFNTSDATVMPKLVVSYDKDGQKGTYTHSYGISKYVSHVTPSASVQIGTDSMIYVQNGFCYHGEVNFATFQLPRPISLYRATLEMTLDTSTSRISANDSLNAFLTKTDGTIDWGYYYYYGNTWGKPSISSTGKRVYKFEVLNFVALWKNGVTIPKIIVGGKNEGLSFDLFRLYGSGSNTPQALQPKLIITYYQKR